MDPLVIKSFIDNPQRWDATNESILKKPFLHISQQRGKKFRTRLIDIFNQIYQLPDQVLTTLSQIIEILHNASLMIDDIEDNSLLRRGVKTSHLVYGIPMTINSANYMYFVAMDLIPKLIIQNNVNMNTNSKSSSTDHIQIQLYRIFNEEICNLHRGQGMDIYWRDANVIPTEEMYMNMVINKTGGLFRLTIRLMETLFTFYTGHNIENSMIPICELLGIIYQIRDDCLNLSDETMTMNKGFAEDITEGKLSFPIIHGLNYEKMNISEENRFLHNTIISKTSNIDVKLKVVKFLKDESKSLDYSKDTIKNLTIILKKQLQTFSNKYYERNISNDQDFLSPLYSIIDYLSSF